MATTAQDIRNALLSNDHEFQKLAEEHFRCEVQLEQLLESPYRSAEDLLLETSLKKRKLHLKDKMESLIAQHRREMRPH
jgi:uncharacterized protein YdcH (DUF465 family)